MTIQRVTKTYKCVQSACKEELKRKLNTVMKTEPKNHTHLYSPVPTTPRSNSDSLLIVPYTSNFKEHLKQ